MANNPYDRREPPGIAHKRKQMGAFLNAGEPRPYFDPMVSRADITMDDLTALVGSVRDRALRSAMDDYDKRLGEQYLKDRYEAWNEGHARGIEEGHTDLLSVIDKQWGEKVRETINAIITATDKEKATKLEYKELLMGVALFLDDLVEAHHSKFTAKIPF